MKIRTQAFLQGYRREKTAEPEQQSLGRINPPYTFTTPDYTGPVTTITPTTAPKSKLRRAGDWFARAGGRVQRSLSDAKANREKRYTDRFNKELNNLVNPTEEYPGFETPKARFDKVIAQGQAEAQRHRDAGTTPTQPEWNKEHWSRLLQPRPIGAMSYDQFRESGLPAPALDEIQKARKRSLAPAAIPKKEEFPTGDSERKDWYDKKWKSRGL